MNDGSETRPDGRAVTEETRRLWVAARALRNHLDELPIDYDLDVSGDRFLAGIAFMFARQRYDCADSMIGAGFGGSVIGSIARSLFVDGLRWLWIGDQPERRRSLLSDLLLERSRICTVVEKVESTCPILVRWLMPLPDVADLTGQSMTWIDAPAMPSEDELLDDFLAYTPDDAQTENDSDHAHRSRRARTLLNISGLRGAVWVLATPATATSWGCKAASPRTASQGTICEPITKHSSCRSQPWVPPPPCSAPQPPYPSDGPRMSRRTAIWTRLSNSQNPSP